MRKFNIAILILLSTLVVVPTAAMAAPLHDLVDEYNSRVVLLPTLWAQFSSTNEDAAEDLMSYVEKLIEYIEADPPNVASARLAVISAQAQFESSAYDAQDDFSAYANTLEGTVGLLEQIMNETDPLLDAYESGASPFTPGRASCPVLETG